VSKSVKSKPYFVVKRAKAGLGLFAVRPIRRGQRIIEYVGKIISGIESDKKGGRYLFEIDRNIVIDGTSRKNLARYINHSCRPNCYAEIDGRRVFIFAKRKIAVGEELAYDYGQEYFKDVIKPDGCRCETCH
jgi:uncharacterized protein